MEDKRTISWIFLATALASQLKPADFNGISMVADGINHAVPNHKELQTSISWLESKGLMAKQGKKYVLTPKGKLEYEKATDKSGIVMEIWEKLENIFKTRQYYCSK